MVLERRENTVREAANEVPKTLDARSDDVRYAVRLVRLITGENLATFANATWWGEWVDSEAKIPRKLLRNASLGDRL